MIHVVAARIATALALCLLLQGSVAEAAEPSAASTTGRFAGAGFDTCEAPSADVMLAWRADPTMPYGAVNAYVGGVNRHCANTALTADWVSSVEGQGWDIVPTYVGLQAPCTQAAHVSTIDPTAAAAQGAAAARDAVARTEALGISVGAPIFADMEPYDTTQSAACLPAVTAFLTAWTRELHVLGYVAGVYGPAYSTMNDLDAGYGAAGTTPPDVIWFAHWNDDPSLFGDTYFSDKHWTRHQRMHQYKGDHDETYGGQKLTIDTDSLDAPVADGSTVTGDGANPHGALTRPVTGAVVHPGRTVTVAGDFSDDTAVGHVDFFVSSRRNGGPVWRRIGRAVPTVAGRASVPWTESAPAGSVLRFRAVAFDTQGRVDTVVRASGPVRVTWPTRLRIGLSDTRVRAAAPVTVKARLFRPDTGAAVARVRLVVERRVHGTTAWHQVTTVVTDTTGRASVVVRPRRSVDFRARYAGSSRYDAAVSAPATVRVRAG